MIEIQCSGGGWGWHQDDPVSLWMRIYVENQLVAEQYHHGTWYITGGVYAAVRASTTDRAVMCTADGSMASGVASGTILGSGPGSVTVKMAAFIPYPWVPNPTDSTTIFEGDNRSFGYANVGSRMTTLIDVYNPAVNDGDILGGPWHEADLTTEYDTETSVPYPPGTYISSAAYNDWVWGYPMKTRWGFGDTSANSCSVQRLGPGLGFSRHSLHCVGSASNPLLLIDAAIDWDLTFTFKYGFNQVEYQVEGCTDGFPAYEAYANGIPLFQESDNGNFLSLFPPCDRNIQTSGVFQ
jgi:hypothetical protein